MVFVIWEKYIQEQVKRENMGTAHQSAVPLGSYVRAFASKKGKKMSDCKTQFPAGTETTMASK